MKRLLLYSSAFISLLVLSFNLLYAQGKISVASFEMDPTCIDAISNPRLDPNGEKCAVIKVETGETGFRFEAGHAAIVGVEQKVGEIWVWVQPGARQLSIFHQHLGVVRGYDLGTSLQSGKVYLLRLTSGTVRTIVEEAKKQTGFLIIESEPSGADVYFVVNGKEEYMGQTPFQKMVEYGKYDFSLKKAKYHDDVGSALIDKMRVNLRSTLLPAFGAVKVTSSPAGANVFLNGENTGKTTPCTLSEVASGTAEIRLQLPDYAPSSRQVTVADGQTASLDIVLDARFAGITINSLPNAEIRINGERKGIGSVTLNLNEGIYNVEASLAHHRQASRQIEVVAKTPQTVELMPTPIYGSLAIMTTPFDASVSIDGKDFGVTPLSVEQLLEGEHTVTLSKAGHATETRRINIAEGRTETLDVKLASGRAVRISTDRTGDRIEIDGNFAGNSPLSTQLAFGTHTVAAIRDGKRASKSVSVEQGQSEIAVTLGFGLQPQFAPSVTSAQRRVLEQLVADMVKVEGGTFTMGATAEQGSDAYSNESPTHSVTLSDYYIGKYEVTQAQWEAVMGSNPSKFKGDNLPVETVSWEDCQKFIGKLNKLTGMNFRLPTEAEWEYAARGGKKSRGYKYAGSNDIGRVAWYDGSSWSKTCPVGKKQANELGIYDMTGNVWEWCADWYDDDYSSSLQTNPIGPSSGSYRVLRGGSWNCITRYCRVSNRYNNSPGNCRDDLGLRLALSENSIQYSNVTSPQADKTTAIDVLTFAANGVTFEMVKVEGGTFTMGATWEDDDEEPTHNVTLSDFYIGKYEVTQAQWQAVMGKTVSQIASENNWNICGVGDDYPMYYISYNDCQEFIRKLNQLTGLNFRLPTEAEWEYAARGGKRSKSDRYAGGHWYSENSSRCPHTVGQKLPNKLGIYDMSGNVWEWCQDWYGSYSSSSQTNPTGPSSGSSRVRRGGSSADSERSSRVSNRGSLAPNRLGNFIGLRLALSENTIQYSNVTSPHSDITTAVDVQTFTANGVVFDMVKVEGGTFTMGATAEQGGEADNDEKPTHSVILSDYYIGKYEVTQAQWKAVMGKSLTQIVSENGWNTYGVGDDYPMYDISYSDCQEFIRKLNQLTGLNFRLPTEAEWEYAARGGKKSRGYEYAGGNDIGRVAWYDGNSWTKTCPVGTKQANELGLYDMSGNVWEWCADWYDNYSSSSQTNPTGPSSGSYRVVRGGSWCNLARNCRVSRRGSSSTYICDINLGLRLALSVE